MKYIIYGLIDPQTKELRYVGQSRMGLKRPKTHMHKSVYTRYNSYLYCWIKSLISKNLTPEILIIEEMATPDQLSESEQFYIAYFKSIGCNLTNLTPGGEVGSLGIKQSPEVIAKRIKKRKTGYKWTAEARKNLSNSKKGVSTGARSDYTKLKISLANRGANNRMFGKKASNRCPIVDQYGKFYNSIRDAAIQHSLQESNIHKVICGIRNHTKGFIFRRLEVSSGG